MNISRISGYTPQTFIQQYGSVGLKKTADVGTLADASQTMSRILQLEAETKRGDDDRWDEFDGIPGKVKIEAPYSSALGCGKEFSELDYDPKVAKLFDLSRLSSKMVCAKNSSTQLAVGKRPSLELY